MSNSNSNSNKQEPNPLRDSIREKALSATNIIRGIKVMFHGAELEIREQSLEVALSHIEAKEGQSVSQAERAVRNLIDYAYVPGQNVRVFEEADVSTLMQLPFNKEWITVQRAMAEMMGVRKEDIDRVEKELENSPLDD